jgi:transcriptional regulator with XRE-family HTH domain
VGGTEPGPDGDAPRTAEDLGRALRQLVRRAREISGRKLTSRELASQTGYSRSAISNWLGGRAVPAADRLDDLLTALGATPGEQRMLATARDGIEEGRLAKLSPGPAAGSADTGPPPPPRGVRYSLPADVASFTGRDQEVESIVAAVRDAARTGVAAVHTLAGMPGAGKTALAVHIAHLLKDQFPDRALFIDLHAHTPGHDPVPPADAVPYLRQAQEIFVRIGANEASSITAELDSLTEAKTNSAP